MKRKVFFLTLVAAIVLTTSVVGAAGYVYHCDFSEWNELKEGETLYHQNPRGMPVGWTFYMPQVPRTPDPELGTIFEPTTDAHVGELAVRVVDNSLEHSIGLVSQDIPAAADTRYLLTAWIKVIKCDPHDSIRVATWFRTSSGLVRDRTIVLNIPPGGDYEKVELLTKPSPAGTTGICIYIWSERAYTSEFLIDDVTVELEPKSLSLAL